MDTYKLDLTNYLDRYPRKKFETLEDYKDRIDTNLLEDYNLDKDMRDKLLNLLLKD